MTNKDEMPDVIYVGKLSGTQYLGGYTEDKDLPNMSIKYTRADLSNAWQDISSAPPKVKKGFVRVYSFKPVKRERMPLGRAYQFSIIMGNRECDSYMDIPAPSISQENEG